MSEYTSWLTSGIPETFDGTFSSCRFEIPINSVSGNVVLVADILTDDPDMPTLSQQRFSLGKGWVVTDDGARAQREDGRATRIHQSSTLGRLIRSLINCPDFSSKLAEFSAQLGHTPEPWTTEFWEGLSGHFNTLSESFKNAEGQDATYSYYVIDRFDGWVGRSADSPQPQPQSQPSSTNHLRPKLLGVAKAMKAQGKTLNEFIAVAYSDHGAEIVNDRDLMTEVDSGALWESA